ncbi:MAG: hypothetical protein M3Q36_03360 [bacterium]|nr:hypothetical protein [bacterium]
MKKPSKRVLLIGIVAVLLVCAGIGSWFYLKQRNEVQPDTQNPTKGHTYYDEARKLAKDDNELANIDFGPISTALINSNTVEARQLLEPYQTKYLSESNRLVFYVLWGRLLAGEQKYNELATHAETVLQSNEIKGNKNLISEWENILNDARSGKNPFTVVSSGEDR